jgi:UDP-N-acetylglucosamine acyltransferase
MKHLFEKLRQHVNTPAIDKIDHIEHESHIVTIKNICLDDDVSPQELIEAHVQSALLYAFNDNYMDNHIYSLLAIESFETLASVSPGDQVRFETEMKQQKHDTLWFESLSYVNGTQCSEIKMTIKQTNPNTSSTFIHPTAAVHPSVTLGQGVHIGPYCIVNEGVTIDDFTTLKAHVLVDKWTTIGKNNAIEYGAVIGSQAQDVKYKGEYAQVVIGDFNQIREYVTINRATGNDAITRIGSHNMLLTNTHIGHNCTIGNHVVMANVVHLGGHVVVDDHATIGGLTGIHQFVRVGTGTMIGGYSRLIQDVPPFMLCDGNPAFVRNLNAIGCKRRGMTKTAMGELKKLYKLLYRSNLNTKQAMDAYESEHDCQEVNHLMAFIGADASRGISKKSSSESPDE